MCVLCCVGVVLLLLLCARACVCACTCLYGCTHTLFECMYCIPTTTPPNKRRSKTEEAIFARRQDGQIVTLWHGWDWVEV